MAKKRTAIKLLGDAKEEYLKLKALVEEEHRRGVASSFHQTLFASISAKIELLRNKYDYGIQIPKRQIPAKYVQQYGVTNLWKVDLAGYWRMIYTLKQPQREQAEVEIITIWLDVLDIYDHERYDKTFGYRKK
jgi:hypothetical protein